MARTSIDRAFFEGKALRELTKSLMTNQNDKDLNEEDFDLMAWGLFAKTTTMCELKRKGVTKKDLISKGIYGYLRDLMRTELFEFKDDKLTLKSRIKNLEKEDEYAMMFLSVFKNLFYTKYKFPPEILRTQYTFIKANISNYQSKGELLEYLDIYFNHEEFNTKFFTESKHSINLFFANINKLKQIFQKEKMS